MGSKKKSKAKKRTGKKKAENRGVFIACSHFFTEAFKALHLETASIAGRINIGFDLSLLAIIIVYLLTSTAASVARIFASIFNHDLTDQAGDSIVSLILIFIGASALCLLFMHITRKEREYYHQSVDEDTISD